MKKKQRIIYMNSNSGYGIGDKKKYCDEKSQLNPISLYGRTKVLKNMYEFHYFSNSIWIFLQNEKYLLLNNLVLLALKNKKLDIFEPHFRRNFIHVRDVMMGLSLQLKTLISLKIIFII